MNARDHASAEWLPGSPDAARRPSIVRMILWIIRPVGVGVAVVAAIMLVVNGLF